MRASAFINFVLVSSATACLMGVVTHRDKQSEASADAAYNYRPSKRVLPPDTPETEEPEEPEEDLQYKFKDNIGRPPMLDPKSKLYLEQPSNIKTDVNYNAQTGNYDITQKIGDQNYRPETYMNLKEYKEYMFKKQMQDYWRTRVAADELNTKPKKGMIPKLQVNSELFDRIFGGNTVDIKPTGTAELIFGLNRNKNLNPSIPQKQQKITNFDFNMRIQLNLIGKIGDKMKITTNYNTEASFDWENQIKVDYTGLEDEILKKIEAGNVTLPLNSTLISGSQTLFGFKTTMQFGKLNATAVFSQQKGKKQEITVQGGSQTTPFNITADNYEQNKHFFLGHYFRRNYDTWMQTIPIVNTPIVITKIEVYVLGVTGSAEQTRNVVAFEDLGEGIMGSGSTDDFDQTYVWPGMLNGSTPGYNVTDLRPDNQAIGPIPDNNANSLYTILTSTASVQPGLIVNRSFNDLTVLTGSTTVSNTNNPGGAYMVEGRDFVKIQNARRLNATEYTFNARLGYISLNQQLNNEQAVAVSYQYTYNGQIYQVGEFSDQIADPTKLLVCKVLKSNSVNVRTPMWRLMMKNVYALGAYNLGQQDFKLDVYYNNIETGVDVPYLPYGAVNGVQLIRVLQCDQLSVNGDRRRDGFYDFVNGYTILTSNGRAYFPTAEPFGRSLSRQFSESDFPGANNYIFNELYDSTKTAATFLQNKNRFKIKGSYRSSSGSEIALNALNIPQGAVVVTANGIPLVENTDYTVDYTLGRVKIINDGILASGATIKISLESNSLFAVQQKNLWGTRLDYKAGRNLTLGSTILRYNERPLTQKVTIGDEPVSNIVVGLDFAYKNDVPFLTRMLDKLPFYSTKEMSSISTRGEFAKLFPGNAKAIGKSGNSYIDDFEGSLGLIDIRSPGSWFLASIPQGVDFPEATFNDSTASGLNRARFNWYNVDPEFTRDQGSTTPNYYSSKKLFSNNMWRQVFETELFPGKTPPNGQQVVLPVLDLGFYPSERGPYNYDVNSTAFSKGIATDGSLNSPETRWGGMMRRLETNDFQASNIEYIQFWMMDPFNEDYDVGTDPLLDKNHLPSGDLYIDLGNISEDVVKDNRMVYENGIPGTSSSSSDLQVDQTHLADVPRLSPTINAFSVDESDRPMQDVGYDGLSDVNEQSRFKNYVDAIKNGSFDQSKPLVQSFINDPSSDHYHFFRGDDYDELEANTLRRYAYYNNPEGNSPTQAQYGSLNPGGGNYPTGATTIPNIEDVNKDNTLNTTENYYHYHLRVNEHDISPSGVGKNFMVDAFTGTATFSGETKSVKWYQFKIPISQYEKVVGGIEGFNSIRFMRVYMKGFKNPVIVRLARFEFVRSDWRQYQFDLRSPGEYLSTDNNSTTFDISAVSLLENSNKVPVNYVMPPEIQQTQNVQTTNLVLQNEQALSMRVCDLKDGDSRAVFKNVDLDTRMFGNIKMNVHAEAMPDQPLNDGDLQLFFRVGSDYNDNFYEYSIPLKLTPKGIYDPNNATDRSIVWPSEDEVNFKFSDITAVKAARNTEYGYFSDLAQLAKPFSQSFGTYTITVVGNPNLGSVKSVMVGIRNPTTSDKQSHCAEVWINELRLTDFNNKGGWASTAQLQAKLADLGTVSFAGTYKTPYWGSVDQKINDRSKETNMTWDVSSSLNIGKFFPSKLKVTLPFYFNYGQTIITPLFNPLDPDQYMKDFLHDASISSSIKTEVKHLTQDYTQRKGFNFTNVRIDGLKRKKAKPMPWDISNFTATYAFNEIYKRSTNVQFNENRTYHGNLQYSYNIRNPIIIKPFAKMKIFDNKWFALIKDFNLQLTPNSFGTSVDINRSYNAILNRDITSLYAGSDVFQNPVLVNKNYTINRSYNFRWDLSKAIKFDYTASNDGRILEPYDSVNYGQVTNDIQKHVTKQITDIFLHGKDTLNQQRAGRFGINTNYRQAMNLNVDLPINKIPILDFAKISYRFGGTYTWSRVPFAVPDSAHLANTIQNTGLHNVTGTFNMMQLYNKIPYFKKINSPPPKQPPGKGKDKKNLLNANDKQLMGGTKKGLTDSTVQGKNNNLKDLMQLLAKTIMMVKNVSLNFSQTSGQALPNFLPFSQFGGMDFNNHAAPGFLFTTGLFDSKIAQRSAQNGWLSLVKQQSTPYTQTKNTTFSYRATVEPHKSLKIELTGNYSKASSLTKYILYVDSGGYTGYNFNASPMETGNFSMSTITFFRSFKDKGNSANSQLFEEFRDARYPIAQQLGAHNALSTGTKSDTLGLPYIDGYSNNQQDVLLGAFYKTYVGHGLKNYSTSNIFPTIPLPNWTVTWDGLGKLPFLKKTFKSITVRHAYKSTYNIGGYTNNVLFNVDSMQQNHRSPVASVNNMTQNFVSRYNITTVTLSESFSPLIKLDFQFVKPGWTANFETRRDRTTSLNVTGYQIIETKGQEYIIGLGYLYPKLKFKKIKIQGKVLESNLTIKIDVSYRRNVSLIRQISDGSSIPTGGTNIITLKSTADYAITQNVTLRLYCDWIRTKPQTSASFPTANTNFGFSIRINFQ